MEKQKKSDKQIASIILGIVLLIEILYYGYVTVMPKEYILEQNRIYN